MDGRSGGLSDSLRRLAGTGVALAQTRLELLAAELEEEKLRLGNLLVFAAAAILLLDLGIVLLAVFLTVLFWDLDRLLVLGILTTAFLVSGAIAAVAAMRLARAGSKLFAASLAELAEDREALRERE
jgi:uncharacterized membrane protein YqjE